MRFTYYFDKPYFNEVEHEYECYCSEEAVYEASSYEVRDALCKIMYADLLHGVVVDSISREKIQKNIWDFLTKVDFEDQIAEYYEDELHCHFKKYIE